MTDLSSSEKSDSQGVSDQKESRLFLAPRIFACFSFICFLVLSLAIRVHLIGIALERDEGEYAYIGSQILAGHPLFASAYTMKLPGTAMMYALFELISGQTVVAIRLGMLNVNLITTFGIYLLSRRFLDRSFSALAAGFYLCLSISRSVLGPMAHATHFVVLFSTYGFWLLLGPASQKNRILLLVAGLLFGLSILMKQSNAPVVLFAGIWVVLTDLKISKKQAVKSGALFAAGVLAPYLILVASIIGSGAFKSFWFWTVTYAKAYASLIDYHRGVLRAVSCTLNFCTGIEWIVGLALVGLVIAIFYPETRRHRFFLIGAFICASFTVSLDLFFRPHYYVLLLPFLSLLAAYAIRHMMSLLRSAALAALISCALIVGATYYSVQSLWDTEYKVEPAVITDQLYGDISFFNMSGQLATFIDGTTPSSATIAVIGSEPQIYYLSRRKAVIPYLYFYPLMENQKFSKWMEADYIHRIETARPDVIAVDEMDLQDDNEYHHCPREFVVWLSHYITKHYSYGYATGCHKRNPMPLFKQDRNSINFWVFRRHN
jgi:hypothetical protein